MTRSRRSTPIVGITTVASDKPFKQQENRRQRHRHKQYLTVTLDDAARRIHKAGLSGEQHGDKDGKRYVGQHWDLARLLRK